MRKLKVFLCHASQDKSIVFELYQKLLAEPWIDPWLDEEKLLPGQDFDLEIYKATRDADAIIICISSVSVKKEGYVNREIRRALDIAQEKAEGAIYVIPLRLDECDPSFEQLKKLHWADYFPQEHRDSAYEHLRKSLELRAEMLQVLFSPLALDSFTATSTAPEPPSIRYLKSGKLTLDLYACQVITNTGILNLPPTSFNYLVVLARHTPGVVDYQTLVAEAQGSQVGDKKSKELTKWHVHNLREALEADKTNPILIVNVRNSGYRLLVD